VPSQKNVTPKSSKSIAEKTSAADKSIGFEYQYYYFLNKVLNLRTGQSAGLEIEDDVHTTLNADLNLLFQLKHTVQSAASGKPVALTELDADLWKTLHNWSKAISDPVVGRTDADAQLKFVFRTEFHLVSNKSKAKSNAFLIKLMQFKEDAIGDFSAVKSHMEALRDKTEDAAIKGYIGEVLSLQDKVLEQFCRRVNLELELDDVIGLVKRSIHEKAVDAERVDAVFQRLDSNIRSDNFIATKQGKPLLVTYEQFMQRYRHVFTDGRSRKLQTFPFNPAIPDDVFAQRFIKRLVEVNDLTTADEELAVEYTTHKLKVAKFLQLWVQKGDLIPDEVEELHGEVLLRWQAEFRAVFKKCGDDSQISSLASELLQLLRRERFRLGEAELNTALSNGELYFLSDDGRLGWHRDWESM
jgi:hypothetical protein